MSPAADKFRFAIDRGGTFTDVYAECPGGIVRALKLLSEDPENYSDAPREGMYDHSLAIISVSYSTCGAVVR